jgi:hypothetical protein
VTCSPSKRDSPDKLPKSLQWRWPRLQSLEKWTPISARALFSVFCTAGSAFPISDSMRSSSAGGSGQSGLFATRSAVRLHPVRAAQPLSVAIHCWRSVSLEWRAYPSRRSCRRGPPASEATGIRLLRHTLRRSNGSLEARRRRRGRRCELAFVAHFAFRRSRPAAVNFALACPRIRPN